MYSEEVRNIFIKIYMIRDIVNNSNKKKIWFVTTFAVFSWKLFWSLKICKFWKSLVLFWLWNAICSKIWCKNLPFSAPLTLHRTHTLYKIRIKEGINVNGKYLSNLRYASDMVLTASSLGELKEIVEELNTVSRVFCGLNFKKVWPSWF